MSKNQIGIRFEPTFIKRVDKAAKIQGMNRTDFITFHLKKASDKVIKRELGYDIDTES
jgi:uncharacterized protein (DUF1778 family)